MDLRLPGVGGTDALISIRRVFPQARIVMLTTTDGDGEIQRALRAGASAYVLKTTPKKELLFMLVNAMFLPTLPPGWRSTWGRICSRPENWMC
jgi:DNA-binding NarL/FixJ family response regulator